jgi:hypothetical protein
VGTSVAVTVVPVTCTVAVLVVAPEIAVIVIRRFDGSLPRVSVAVIVPSLAVVVPDTLFSTAPLSALRVTAAPETVFRDASIAVTVTATVALALFANVLAPTVRIRSAAVAVVVVVVVVPYRDVPPPPPPQALRNRISNNDAIRLNMVISKI